MTELVKIYNISDENRISKSDFSQLCSSIIRMGTTDECKASLVGKNEENKKACVPLLESKNFD